MIDQIRGWLATLSPRERNLVYAAGALLGAALLYLVLVLPFTTTTRKLAARVEQKTNDLAWMREAAPHAMAAAGMASRNDGESLVVIVDRAARQAGLGTALRDQSPSGEGGVRLRLEGASFDTVGPGLVNATLALTQPGAAG